MMTKGLRISGYPLPEPGITILPDKYHPGELTWDNGPRISDEDALRIVEAWASAPTEDEVVRSFHHDETNGQLLTALYMEGEVDISCWNDDYGLYWLHEWPFDFEVDLIDVEVPWETDNEDEEDE